MYQKLVFVVYFVVVIGLKDTQKYSDNEDDVLTRILFGTPVDSYTYPFFAILDGCGGAIISEWWIITAAHCVVKNVLVAPFYPKYVCIGGNSESTCYGFTYNKVIVHPGYRSNAVKHDIAVIRLSTKLRFGPEIQKINLPTTPFYNGWLTLVAKGKTQNMRVSDTVEMVNLYGYNGPSCSETGIGEGFCAVRNFNYDPATCFGDSGSPLVRDDTLIGIISAIGRKNCFENKYTYAINIAYYLPWIRAKTGIYM